MNASEKNPLSLEDRKTRGEAICVVGKGGVGKSIISANLGPALAQLGLKTLVVDADVEDANLGLIYGVGFDVATIQDYLSGKITVEESIIQIKNKVDLVPGSVRVEALTGVSLDLFQDFITQMAEKYQIILADSPAGLGIDTLTVVSSCENMLIVATPVITSVAFAIKMKIIAERTGCNVLGLVVNRAGSPHDIPREHMEDVTGLRVIATIPEDEEVKKSVAEGNLLMFQRSKSPATIGIKSLAAKITKLLGL